MAVDSNRTRVAGESEPGTLPDATIATRLTHYAHLLEQLRARTSTALLGLPDLGQRAPRGSDLAQIRLESRQLDKAYDEVMARIERRANRSPDETVGPAGQQDVDELCLQIGRHHRLQEMIRDQAAAAFEAEHRRQRAVPPQVRAPAVDLEEQRGPASSPRHLRLLTDADVATLREAWSDAPLRWFAGLPGRRTTGPHRRLGTEPRPRS